MEPIDPPVPGNPYKLKKITLEEDLQRWGPVPEKTDEIFQKITIFQSGWVTLAAYGCDFAADSDKYIPLRKERRRIPEKKAREILWVVRAWLDRPELQEQGTLDAGCWKLTAESEAGERRTALCSVGINMMLDCVDIRKLIENALPFRGVTVF